jgi:transposase
MMMENAHKPTYDELLIENTQLKKRVAEQDVIIAQQASRITELEQEVAELKAQIAKLTKMLFGKKSEKTKKDKPPKTSSGEPKQKREKNGGGGRKPFGPKIPRRDVGVPLPPDECRCAHCGAEYEPMGVEISEVLNFIPMIAEVIRLIRQRMKPGCDCPGNKIIIAELPIRNIDKGMVTTEFIAALLVAKYCDHNPIYRQVNRMLKSMGLDIAESSVCRWRDQVADQLEILVDLMKSRIKQSYCINTDASTAPCRLPQENHRQVNGNIYVYIGGEDQPYNIFDFQPNQSAAPVHQFLVGYFGVIQADAHSNYDALFIPPKQTPDQPLPKRSGCNSHCRRNFVEAESKEPQWVKRFLDIYKKLYKIEAQIKDEAIEVRYDRRQNDSLPILDSLFDLCRACLNDPTILPKSALGQACSYALNHEAALRFYCTDGRLNIDNNVSERTLRGFVLGRKNWLFFGSPEAGNKSAIIMSLLSSARRHGLNEWEYLVDVLYRLSDWNPRVDSLESLLPDRWEKSPVPPTEAAAMAAR